MWQSVIVTLLPFPIGVTIPGKHCTKMFCRLSLSLGRACISGNTIANEFRPPEKSNRDSAQSSIARRRARRGSVNGCERGKEEEGQFIFMEQRGAQMHRHFATHSFTSSRLRNLGDRSGEFCICKLIVSTYIEKIGTMHTTKHITSPSRHTH